MPTKYWLIVHFLKSNYLFKSVIELEYKDMSYSKSDREKTMCVLIQSINNINKYTDNILLKIRNES